MTNCGARQEQAHGPNAHSCVGDPGHAGPHWCLLGHTWTDANTEDSAA
jgi:hypothetical protein